MPLIATPEKKLADRQCVHVYMCHEAKALKQANAYLLEIKGFDVKLRKNNVRLVHKYMCT